MEKAQPKDMRGMSLPTKIKYDDNITINYLLIKINDDHLYCTKRENNKIFTFTQHMSYTIMIRFTSSIASSQLHTHDLI